MYIENLLLVSDGGGSFLAIFLIVVLIILLQKRGVIPTISAVNKGVTYQTDYFYIKELLIFTTHIVLIDGNVSKKETEYVNKFMFREYGKRRQKKYVSIISGYIRNGYNLENAIKRTNSKCDMSSKLQLLHFLIKVSIVDGYLADSEFSALSEITGKLNLTYHQLNSILAMYNYTSEKSEREKKKYKKQKTTTRQSKLKLAFTVLELDDSASDEEIKKAYKKLVNIHHPDKVLHLDSVQQKYSLEKFHKILDAYKLLKTNKGFK